jgi:hypothetical protein
MATMLTHTRCVLHVTQHVLPVLLQGLNHVLLVMQATTYLTMGSHVELLVLLVLMLMQHLTHVCCVTTHARPVQVGLHQTALSVKPTTSLEELSV